MLPVGPDPRRAITRGFFDIIKANKDKLGLKTIAIATGDGEATRNGSDGARQNAKEAGLQIVYDKTYPLNTTDFSPVIRALQATNADVILISSYPGDSVGIIRSANELGLKTKVSAQHDGAAKHLDQDLAWPDAERHHHVRLVAASTEDDVPRCPGVSRTLSGAGRPARASSLGYYLGPWAYARMQVLGDAIEGTKAWTSRKSPTTSATTHLTPWSAT